VTAMNFAERRPITTYLLLMYPVAWALAGLLFVLRVPVELAIAVANLVGVLGPAVLVSYWIGGPEAVRRLFAGVLHWRVGIGWYVLAIVAMPVLTIAISLVTGTLPHTQVGWLGLCLSYLLSLLIGGASTNLWEEVAWAGFVQSRLTARHGLLIGAVATGPLFAAQHLPIIVANGGGLGAMVVLLLALAVLSIFFRYVLGVALLDTGGSLLIVGILHASSDAAGSKFGTGWQSLVASVVLALALLAYRALRHRPVNAHAAIVEPEPTPV
jgi:uncharacterized protein